MNNMDLLKAIGDIDDKYLNDEIAKEEKNRDVPQIKVNVMKRFKIKYVLASVCVIIIAVIGISKMNLFNSSKEIGDYKWKVKEAAGTSGLSSQPPEAFSAPSLPDPL